MGIGRVFRDIGTIANILPDMVKNNALGTVAYTRLTVRRSYEYHLRLIRNDVRPVSLPEWMTAHQGALVGVLYERYGKSLNRRKAAVMRNKIPKRFLLFEMLPFGYLSPPEEGVETLGEYVAWKENRNYGLRVKVRLEWLRTKVREGLGEAQKAGFSSIVMEARNFEPQIPWVELLQEGTDTPGSYEATG